MFILKRRRQNQKFPSFQIFRFAAGVVGGAANKNNRKFLGFAPRELVERDRGASVIRQNPADFVRNTFELRPKHTAKIPGRPVFNEMMERMEKGEASGILAWHPDRLARNSVDGGKIIYLVDTGVISEMKFPTFWFDPTPQGKFM